MYVIGGKSSQFKTKCCYFCKESLDMNIVETDMHIFVECRIARLVWHCINQRLQGAYLDTIVLNESNIFYKRGIEKPQSHLISEVNWALWKNRCSNVYDETLNSHTAVLKFLFNRLKLVSKIDKAILGIRAYNNRWLGLNQVIEALDDN